MLALRRTHVLRAGAPVRATAAAWAAAKPRSRFWSSQGFDWSAWHVVRHRFYNKVLRVVRWTIGLTCLSIFLSTVVGLDRNLTTLTRHSQMKEKERSELIRIIREARMKGLIPTGVEGFE